MPSNLRDAWVLTACFAPPLHHLHRLHRLLHTAVCSAVLLSRNGHATTVRSLRIPSPTLVCWLRNMISIRTALWGRALVYNLPCRRSLRGGGLSLLDGRLGLSLNLFALLRLLRLMFVACPRSDIQALVDGLGDRLDLRAQLLFNTVEVEPILVCHEVDRQTQVSETS